jgi:hypothetical protein
MCAPRGTHDTFFFLEQSPISWSSQKQKVVALSSCEAEYIAAVAAACQGVWLVRLLAEVRGGEPAQVKINVDNKSAISCVRIQCCMREVNILIPSIISFEIASRMAKLEWISSPPVINWRTFS